MALLRIDPNSEVHFWLNDETPQCTLNVHHVDPTEGPVAYRVSLNVKSKCLETASFNSAMERISQIESHCPCRSNRRKDISMQFIQVMVLYNPNHRRRSRLFCWSMPHPISKNCSRNKGPWQNFVRWIRSL